METALLYTTSVFSAANPAFLKRHLGDAFYLFFRVYACSSREIDGYKPFSHI